MQKIGISVLENMVRKKITNKELEFILHIAKYQNEYGIVTGIYYKDVCKAIGQSYEGFYDCKNSLEKKGIISVTKNSYYDWDITILNNSAEDQKNDGRGYVSLRCNMLYDSEFHNCRAGSKLLGLLLMRDWLINVSRSYKKSYQILKENFMKKYTELFCVSGKVLRGYLGELKPFLDVYLENGRKYFFTFKSSASGLKHEISKRSESEELRYHDIKSSFRRNRIKEDEHEDTGKEIEKVLRQHNPEIINNPFYNLSLVIQKTLEILNESIKNPSKWKRKLNVPLVHKVLVDHLQIA